MAMVALAGFVVIPQHAGASMSVARPVSVATADTDDR